MHTNIVNHFKQVDPIFSKLVEKLHTEIEVIPSSPENYFLNLCKSIINQQVSNKAGAVIFGRLLALFSQGQVTPEGIIKLTDEQLREVGVSRPKVVYMKDLSQKVVSGEVNLGQLQDEDSEGVIEKLTQVKGIGVWTAEMFLMFSLARPDIFSHGDLGLKNAIKKIYNLENPTNQEIEQITIKWSPYRSYASKILWKSLNL